MSNVLTGSNLSEWGLLEQVLIEVDLISRTEGLCLDRNSWQPCENKIVKFSNLCLYYGKHYWLESNFKDAWRTNWLILNPRKSIDRGISWCGKSSHWKVVTICIFLITMWVSNGILSGACFYHLSPLSEVQGPVRGISLPVLHHYQLPNSNRHTHQILNCLACITSVHTHIVLFH